MSSRRERRTDGSAGTALAPAQQRCAVDPQAVKSETGEARVTVMQTGSALFAAATAPEYRTADEARAASADGLVALGPLAMACLARDQGITVDTGSEYLPKALLDYARIGEAAY
ncbi:Imm49 family immunity protein [Streptomyces sp. DH24]|uniref:Imm49 family immunity protein n=1 Tax=Streptomyces sp. DH24 TaxID=3040123 RepID=UPI002443553A|nr:Imm49 family immunity protein [Streptomyces sp. DH24]MDG9716421.1 Imm49 family immunity protein [Streptomyces sp. DH24]